MRPSLLFSVSFLSLCFFLHLLGALRLRSLWFHSPRLCRVAVFLIQTNASLFSGVSSRRDIIIRARYCCQLKKQACVEEGAQLQQRPPYSCTGGAGHPLISLVMLFGWRGCDGLSLPCYSPRPQLPPLAAYFAYAVTPTTGAKRTAMCSLGL